MVGSRLRSFQIQKIFDGPHVKSLVDLLRGRPPSSQRSVGGDEGQHLSNEGVSTEQLVLEDLWQTIKFSHLKDDPGTPLTAEQLQARCGRWVRKLKPEASRSQSREIFLLVAPLVFKNARQSGQA